MNEEIAEGIKFAMSKGETLQQAMQSFYNAGYSRQEVEEAARSLQNQLHIESERGIHAVHPNFGPMQQNQKNGNENSEASSAQKVSSYESATQEENPRKKMIVLVSILLVVLLLVFAGIFFFRGYLLQLFGNLFG